jgi:hypothetical protein
VKPLPIPKPAKSQETTIPANKPPEASLTNLQPSANPDYAAIVRFLIEPFLESPESLRVDCEIHPRQAKAWIRLAFDESEKGRVYGRGGRNIQAIRTVLSAVAQSGGHSVFLDIYDEKPENNPSFSPNHDRDRGHQGRDSSSRPSGSRRSVSTPKFRTERNDRAMS